MENPGPTCTKTGSISRGVDHWHAATRVTRACYCMLEWNTPRLREHPSLFSAPVLFSRNSACVWGGCKQGWAQNSDRACAHDGFCKQAQMQVCHGVDGYKCTENVKTTMDCESWLHEILDENKLSTPFIHWTTRPALIIIDRVVQWIHGCDTSIWRNVSMMQSSEEKICVQRGLWEEYESCVADVDSARAAFSI